MEIDLHGMELWEALEEILLRLEECQAKGIHEISIIHGYHGGGILKNYIQSDNFIKKNAPRGLSIEKKRKLQSWCVMFFIVIKYNPHKNDLYRLKNTKKIR